MEEYLVKQGDSLSSIGYKFGIAWKKIYDHADNAEFRKKRGDPNIIFPGDRIVIPDKEDKTHDCSPGNSYRFKIKDNRPALVLILYDEEEEIMAQTPYTLEIGNQVFEGKTDDNGKLEKKIPQGVQEGQLKAGAYEYTLKFNYLDPIEEASGIQQRLNNLGFSCGEEDGIIGDRTRFALANFQRKHDLEVDGELSDKTRDKLKEVYGC